MFSLHNLPSFLFYLSLTTDANSEPTSHFIVPSVHICDRKRHWRLNLRMAHSTTCCARWTGSQVRTDVLKSSDHNTMMKRVYHPWWTPHRNQFSELSMLQGTQLMTRRSMLQNIVQNFPWHVLHAGDVQALSTFFWWGILLSIFFNFQAFPNRACFYKLRVCLCAVCLTGVSDAHWKPVTNRKENLFFNPIIGFKSCSLSETR